ncbi:hypothetical protein [Streptomyces cylindrosporus]|uniref:Uncharacterized protein n=1 Tax=Streptomyces cylindrosporus TaxID=2927583 RepID=A0ABS9YK54_9ACTN|nr:hypothetical protein [Streptomyces cylindrosporus]MCI3277637.1 hypothetical protein [Streptomyces cylindrosporus]
MDTSSTDPVHGAEAERWGGWSWREASRGEHYRTCSYCGCIHPDDLAAETDWRAEWADRKYGYPHKFYVTLANRRPEQRFITGATTGTPTGLVGTTWIRADEVPDDVNTDGWRDLAGTYEWVSIGTRPTHHAKFYTVHLADPALGHEARDRIQSVSGLRLRFEDGRVWWEPYA